MKIFLASDHAGFELKSALVLFIKAMGHEPEDLGNDHYDPNDNYPEFIFACAEAVVKNQGSMGIIIGGSGQGEAIAANKFPEIRAAVFYGGVLAKAEVDITGRTSKDPYEIIKLSRQHNNSNVLSLGARFLSLQEAQNAVKTWLETPFSGLQRYGQRNDHVEARAKQGTDG